MTPVLQVTKCCVVICTRLNLVDVDVVPLATIYTYKRVKENPKTWKVKEHLGKRGQTRKWRGGTSSLLQLMIVSRTVVDCCPRFILILLLNAFWILRFLLLENVLHFTTQTWVTSAGTWACVPLGFVGRCRTKHVFLAVLAPKISLALFISPAIWDCCAENTFARIVLSHILPVRSLCIAIGQLRSRECRTALGLAAAAIGCSILLQLVAAFGNPRHPT